MYQKIFFFFLAICLMPSCQMFKDLNESSPYEDIAKTFTEKTLKKIFDVNVSLDKDSIFLQKRTTYERLKEIFPEKYLQKFTAEGYAEVHNLRIKTKVSWQYYPDTKIVLIYFKRIKKPILQTPITDPK